MQELITIKKEDYIYHDGSSKSKKSNKRIRMSELDSYRKKLIAKHNCKDVFFSFYVSYYAC